MRCATAAAKPKHQRLCTLSAARPLLGVSCWVLTQLLIASWQAGCVVAQRPLQFIPDGLATNIPARLVFRTEGLVEALSDADGSTAVLRDAISLDPVAWRKAFATTSGAAMVGPSTGQNHPNFTITGEPVCLSGDCTSLDDSRYNSLGASGSAPSINFNKMTYAIMVKRGGLLQIQNVALYGVADAADYVYSPAQPYRIVILGSNMWPTIAMEPGATLSLVNVTVSYRNTAPDLSCEQRVDLGVYSMQQMAGGKTVVRYNRTAGRVPGRIEYTLKVLNGNDNTTLGEATFVSHNVTFNCLPAITSQKPSTGLSTAQLTAAIAAPVGLAVIGLLCCLVCRYKRQSSRALVSSWCGKDVESVICDDSGSKATSMLGGKPVAQSDSSSCNSSTSSTALRAYGSFHELSAAGHAANAQVSAKQDARLLLNNGAAVAADRWSQPGMSQAVVFPGSVGSESILTSPPATVQQQEQPSVQLQVQGSLAAQGSSASTNCRDEMQSTVGPSPDWASAETQSPSPAATAARSPANNVGKSGCSPQSQRQPEGTADHLHSNSSLAAQPDSAPTSNPADVTNTGMQEAWGHPAAGQHSSRVSSPAVVACNSGRSPGRCVPALLKARSDLSVLRDLAIGPLLGRGSYGRVYKGRWRSVTVAVKIIEHRYGALGTASSCTGKHIMINRETTLATSMAHPNVVQTFHISTMTAAQRAAVTSSMQTDTGEGASNRSSPVHRKHRRPSAATADYNDEHSDSSDDEKKEPLETWMIMEFCEKGSLEKELRRGRFLKLDGAGPEMIGIYKALLDTASGLDYLHSIGVVHGDLKTANVLLKGSTRDVRGFACKITDFGLSRVLDLDATHISTRTYGTITYMPREMLLTGHMSQATDIYSFGLMMWELYTNSSVFEDGMSVGQMFYMIAYGNWRPTIPHGCPLGYAALMQSCWHEDPGQRPTAQQLLSTLQKLYLEARQLPTAARGCSPGQIEHSRRSTYQDWPPVDVDETPTASMVCSPAVSSGRVAATDTGVDSGVSCTTVGSVHVVQRQVQQEDQQTQLQGSQVGNDTGEGVFEGPTATTATVGAVAADKTGAFGSVSAGGDSPSSRVDWTQQHLQPQYNGSAATMAPQSCGADQDWAHAATLGQQPQQPGPDAPPWNQYNQQPCNIAYSSMQHGQHPTATADNAVTSAAPGFAGPEQQALLQAQQQSELHRQLSSYYQMRSSIDVQPAVDNESLLAESLFRADTNQSTSTAHNVSNSGNVLGPDEQPLVPAASYHTDTWPRSESSTQQLTSQHQHSSDQHWQDQQAEQWFLPEPPNYSAAAAQSFLAALDMVTRPATLEAVAPTAYAGYPAALPATKLPYHYQLRPMMVQHVLSAALEARGVAEEP